MDAARVIAQHAAERAMVMSGGVWAPRQGVGLGSIAECVAYRSGLDTSIFLVRIQLNDVVQIFRPINDNRNVAALACQTCPAASRKQWSAEPSTQSNRINYVLPGFGNDYANGNLPIVGAVGRIQRLAPGIEANFAGYCFSQKFLHCPRIDILRTIPP
jgi:hypothetical protein